MVSKYSPACVRNPSSMHHLVKIQPGQEISIVLSKSTHATPTVEISSPYLFLAKQWEDSEKATLRISQVDLVRVWGQYSSTYLGEVWIDYKEGLSRLLVLQDCVNPDKRHHITAVNPDCYDLRVSPHHLMEFILCEPSFGYTDEWMWHWDASLDCVQVDCLGQDTKSLYNDVLHCNFDPPSQRYAKCPRVKVESGKVCRQHHFWFRFGESIRPLIDSEVGIVHVGNFHFFGSNKHVATQKLAAYHASIYLNLRKKKAAAFDKALQSAPLRSHYRPQFQMIVKKPALPVINEVVISRVETSSLDQGCKTLSAEPPSKEAILVCDDYDEYDLAEYCNYPARFHRRLQKIRYD